MFRKKVDRVTAETLKAHRTLQDCPNCNHTGKISGKTCLACDGKKRRYLDPNEGNPKSGR